ncbi:MAG: hypothetical protein LIO86_15160 [Lachnospiraceae bacterium]|nr:hypothetical protein [Lachnospiraceae bacterium]
MTEKNRRLWKEQVQVISLRQVRAFRLKGKPKCPACRAILTHVYDEAARGHTNQKCLRCGRKSWVNLETMECRLIVEDDM